MVPAPIGAACTTARPVALPWMGSRQTAFEGSDLPCGQGSRLASVVVLARLVCFLSSVGRAFATLGLRQDWLEGEVYQSAGAVHVVLVN